MRVCERACVCVLNWRERFVEYDFKQTLCLPEKMKSLGVFVCVCVRCVIEQL